MNQLNKSVQRKKPRRTGAFFVFAVAVPALSRQPRLGLLAG